MREKIFTRLKQEYAPLGLDENFLSGLADMLATSGLVTDENIESVIANQKNYLQEVQKSNDKRVQDAVAKTQRKATEAADAAKAEHDKAVAELQRQLDELKATKTPPDDDSDLRDLLSAEKAEREKQLAEMRELMQSLQTAKTESDNKLKAMEEERAAEKTARAAADRKAHIATKAKEKGIPDWMIAHGFADITSDADDAKINQILDQYANEIQTSLLPSGAAGLRFNKDEKATQQEIDAALDKIFPKRK